MYHVPNKRAPFFLLVRKVGPLGGLHSRDSDIGDFGTYGTIAEVKARIIERLPGDVAQVEATD